MTWTATEYGATDGHRYVCRVNTNGCTLFVGHIFKERVGIHEDLSEILVRLFWPDEAALRAFLKWGGFYDTRGSLATDAKKCREAWDAKADELRGKE